jgi:hypothetical protein
MTHSPPSRTRGVPGFVRVRSLFPHGPLFMDMKRLKGSAPAHGFMMTHHSDAFSRLLELHRPAIYQFLLASLRDKDLAEMLTQECLLKAFRSRSRFRGESSVRMWLMRIVINLQKDRWRDRRGRFWRNALRNAVDINTASDRLTSQSDGRRHKCLLASRWRRSGGSPTI